MQLTDAEIREILIRRKIEKKRRLIGVCVLCSRFYRCGPSAGSGTLLQNDMSAIGAITSGEPYTT